MAPTKRKMVAPSAELGFVNPFSGLMAGFTQWDFFEQVPELTWPNSVRTYTRMSREDGRIASILAAVSLPIRRTAWRIDPAGASPGVTKFVARNLGLPIRGEDEPEQALERTRDRFSWSQHLQQALQMLVFGHSVFEQVYRIEDGKAILRKLAPRPSQTIAFWEVARDGGLVGIQQYPEGVIGSAGGGVTFAGAAADPLIPINRLVVYTRDADPGVWTGNSLLRPAYKHWLLKDELIRVEATAARRNGVGVPVVTAPDNVSDNAIGSQDLQPYLEIARSYRGGNTAGVALPNGAALKIQGVDGNLPSGFIRQAIEYHDKQMALAALAHFLNLDKGGSFALASVQADAFTQSIQTIAEIIRDTAQAHIVEDLVDINFGTDVAAPRITIDEIGSRQDATAAALQMLVSAGILHPDPRLEAFERQTLGLPAVDPDAEDDDETDEPPAETAAPETAAPPVPETNVSNARILSVEEMRRELHPFGDPTPPRAPNRVPVRAHTRSRIPRARIEPNGALTLW